jgi:hypothetical protein
MGKKLPSQVNWCTAFNLVRQESRFNTSKGPSSPFDRGLSDWGNRRGGACLWGVFIPQLAGKFAGLRVITASSAGGGVFLSEDCSVRHQPQGWGNEGTVAQDSELFARVGRRGGPVFLRAEEPWDPEAESDEDAGVESELEEESENFADENASNEETATKKKRQKGGKAGAKTQRRSTSASLRLVDSASILRPEDQEFASNLQSPIWQPSKRTFAALTGPE